jgi:PIN domain nuclease of toxin-antitoxin system
LKPLARAAIVDPNNRILISVASLWEIVIKVSIKKLPLDRTYDELIRLDIEGNNIEILPVEHAHLKMLGTLPLHHRDPFDRLIIAQSLAENCDVFTADDAFDAYGVRRIW